jgi:hypothetical protein
MQLDRRQPEVSQFDDRSNDNDVGSVHESTQVASWKWLRRNRRGGDAQKNGEPTRADYHTPPESSVNW